MVTPEFKSYVNAVQKYLEGYPIQFYYEGNVWQDHDETVIPVFDYDYWRVKPGEYIWTRLYRIKGNEVAVAHAASKDCLLSTEYDWIDEPRLVRIGE